MTQAHHNMILQLFFYKQDRLHAIIHVRYSWRWCYTLDQTHHLVTYWTGKVYERAGKLEEQNVI
jgi:hypothetical protein